ncbi:MAG: hypothetical protein WA632_11895 [Gallionella sp.]
MKQTAFITALILLTLAGCDAKKVQEPYITTTPQAESMPPLPAGHPSVDGNDQTRTLSGETGTEQTQKATVISIINIPDFTYLEVKQNNQKRWLATSSIAAKKGDAIQFDNGSTITDFRSKKLNRTFANMTFVNNAAIITK